MYTVHMHRNFHSQRGVALILVIFIVTLASVLVINLAYSTYLGSRVSAGAQRAVQAEYLLKSTLSLAQILVAARNPNFDSTQDFWAMFYEGVPIPIEYLGVNQPNLRLSLEIRPEDVNLNLHKLYDKTRSPAQTQKWIGIFTSFFKAMGFDDDFDETDQSGLFPKKHFKSQELAISLIEYQDEDTQSYPNGGYEGDVKDAKDIFANTYIKSLTELSRIPGFTPTRVNKILPYITVNGIGDIHLNFVTGLKGLDPTVLQAIDPSITSTMIQQLHDIAVSKQPFESGVDSKFTSIIPRNLVDGVNFTASSKNFQVIAEADYGTSRYFLRAHLIKDPNGATNLPKVSSVELF